MTIAFSFLRANGPSHHASARSEIRAVGTDFRLSESIAHKGLRAAEHDDFDMDQRTTGIWADADDGNRKRRLSWPIAKYCFAVRRAKKSFAELPNWLTQKTGVQILRRALEAPARTIAENSAVDAGVAVARMLQEQGDIGFDAAANRYVDMYEAGIIDPTKVVRSALKNAVSVASVLLLTEATMTEIPQKESPAEPPFPT